jgi:hypothetical protein
MTEDQPRKTETATDGRFEFKEVPAGTLSIMTTPDYTSGFAYNTSDLQRPVAVRANLSFELDGLFGSHSLMVAGAPRGWIVKSIKYGDDDVTDTAIEFKSGSNPRSLEVTLTNQGAIVTGRVLNDDGTESPDASVVVLPGDVSRWRPIPGLPPIPPNADGTFTVGPMRAGEYIVAAVTGLSTAQLIDPSGRAAIAARIAKAGERIVLVESEKRSIELRVTKLR